MRDVEIRGLSLWQPWASLLAHGLKTVETRGWEVYYRGKVAVHASKRLPAAVRLACEDPDDPLALAMRHAGIRRLDDLPRGAIVAVADLVGCFRFTRASRYEGPASEGRWVVQLADTWDALLGDCRPGRYGWVFRNVRPLPKPIPCNGELGLWIVPPDVAARLVPVIAT